MPVSYINHKGKKILYVDLSESKSEKRSLELLEETKNAYLSANEKLLVLVNTEDAYVNPVISSKMKEYGKQYFNDRAEKRAYLGVSGLKQLIMKAFSRIVGNNIRFFDSKEEALEYLVN